MGLVVRLFVLTPLPCGEFVRRWQRVTDGARTRFHWLSAHQKDSRRLAPFPLSLFSLCLNQLIIPMVMQAALSSTCMRLGRKGQMIGVRDLLSLPERG